MSGKFARLGLCDWVAAEEKKARRGTLSTHSKKVTCLTGIAAFPTLTFCSDDDDFNVSDVKMSRIVCSADEGGVAFKVLQRFQIHSVSRRIYLPHAYIINRHSNTDMNQCKGIQLAKMHQLLIWKVVVHSPEFGQRWLQFQDPPSPLFLVSPESFLLSWYGCLPGEWMKDFAYSP